MDIQYLFEFFEDFKKRNLKDPNHVFKQDIISFYMSRAGGFEKNAFYEFKSMINLFLKKDGLTKNKNVFIIDWDYFNKYKKEYEEKAKP